MATGRGEVQAIMSVPFKDGAGSAPVPDVDAIMQRVRAGIAGKLRRGEYGRADLAALRRVEHEPRERTDFGPAPSDDLARVHSSWDPLGPYPFSSHRGGIGALIVAAKRVLHRLARPVAAVTLARQAEFNGAVVRLLTGACRGVQSLEADNETMARRLHDLECRNRELQAEIDGLRSRIEPDGRAAVPE